MKIVINIDEQALDTEIALTCKKLTPDIEKLISTIRILDKQFMVTKDDITYILDVTKVIYIEAVERKTFVYTKEQVYESALRLYELEEQLYEYGFFRASKSCLLQLKCIKSLKSDFDRKIRLTMDNDEQIMVSRQYAESLKKRLGVK